MRVLLLGIDETWATTLMRCCAARGHPVAWQRDLPVGSRCRNPQRADLLLLDLLDAGGAGPRLLAQLRRSGDATPLLAFTAAGNAQARVRALDLGADDCQAWPCDLDELEARCRAILRRLRGLAAEAFHHGRFRLDLAAHRASIDDATLALPRREYALLQILVGRFGHVVRKDELGRMVFSGGEVVGSNALEVYVARLRRRLAGAGIRIQTVRGVGYRLEPDR